MGVLMDYKVNQNKSVWSSVWCDIFALDDTKNDEKLGKYWICDQCINFSNGLNGSIFLKLKYIKAIVSSTCT